MINRERSYDLTARSENNMDIANAHKSKTNIAITRIGTMVDMTDFSSLCINCGTIISANCQQLGTSTSLPTNPTQVCQPNEQSRL
jgi:hypothetical protein